MARPKTMETRKLVSLTADLSKAIEDYRFVNRIPSESEAIRRLIEAGLKAGDKIPIRGSKPEPSGGSNVAENTSPTSKPARASRTQKTAPLSKEAQLRALREQGAR